MEKWSNSSEILKHLTDRSGIIGLEYLVELVNSENTQKSFFCILCKVGQVNLENSIKHLKDWIHKEKYLEKHFSESYAKVLNYFSKQKGEMEVLTSLIIEMIEKDPLYLTMRPSIFLHSEFMQNPKRFFKIVHEKDHQRETLRMQLAVTEELIALKRKILNKKQNDLFADVKYKNVPVQSNDDVILLQPEFPKINLCDSDHDDDEKTKTQPTVQQALNDTKEFFENHNREKIHETCTEEVTKKSNVKSLTNEEIEILMSNFQMLSKVQQNDLLKYLNLLQKDEPERFKSLKSPF